MYKVRSCCFTCFWWKTMERQVKDKRRDTQSHKFQDGWHIASSSPTEGSAPPLQEGVCSNNSLCDSRVVAEEAILEPQFPPDSHSSSSLLPLRYKWSSVAFFFQGSVNVYLSIVISYLVLYVKAKKDNGCVIQSFFSLMEGIWDCHLLYLLALGSKFLKSEEHKTQGGTKYK